MRDGWIKLHRKMLDNPIVCADTDTLAVWIYLLLTATAQPYEMFYGKELILLNAGQLVAGRKQIAEKLKLSDSKVQRVLTKFEKAKIIEQKTGNRKRLITIKNWSDYIVVEQ